MLLQAIPHIEALPEYKALEDEDARKAAFSKFVRRQKEKIKESQASEDGDAVSVAASGSRARDDRRPSGYHSRGERAGSVHSGHGGRERDRDRDRDRDREDRHHRDRDKDRDRSSRYDRERERHSDRKSSYAYDDRDKDYRKDRDRRREYRDDDYDRGDRRSHRDKDRSRERDKDKDKGRDRDTPMDDRMSKVRVGVRQRGYCS